MPQNASESLREVSASCGKQNPTISRPSGKRCTRCRDEKPLERFSRDRTRHDGLHPYCKACTSRRDAAYYDRNRERIKQRVREFVRLNPERCRERGQLWYAANADRKRSLATLFYHENRAEQRARRNAKARTPEARAAQRERDLRDGRGKARDLVQAAVRRGRLKRQPCEVCGATPAEGHHDDYSKPLTVRWLCRRCHAKHHRKYQGAVS